MVKSMLRTLKNRDAEVFMFMVTEHNCMILYNLLESRD